MPGIAAEPEDESIEAAVERMLDDGAPVNVVSRIRRSRWSPLQLLDEPSAEEVLLSGG